MERVHIVAEIVVKPEFRDELRPVLEELVRGSRAEQGNIMYDLTAKMDDPCHLVVMEIWQSAAALEEHNATPHFQAFSQAAQGKTSSLRVIQLKAVI